jgi:hypothetical protein
MTCDRAKFEQAVEQAQMQITVDGMMTTRWVGQALKEKGRLWVD